MRYRKLSFEIPVGWDINHCFVKIKDGKVIMDHPIDHMIYERCTSELQLQDESCDKSVIGETNE